MLGLYASKGSLIDGNKLTKVWEARGSPVKHHRRERELQTLSMVIKKIAARIEVRESMS